MLAELVADARQNLFDPGSDQLLESYNERRSGDIRSRALLVDLANRSLMTDFLPVHAVRALGLHLASRVGFFRRALMRQGLGPNDEIPRLARGQVL
jgi:2-octaprenyl-6-methoxyphenol hydroxylase